MDLPSPNYPAREEERIREELPKVQAETNTRAQRSARSASTERPRRRDSGSAAAGAGRGERPVKGHARPAVRGRGLRLRHKPR